MSDQHKLDANKLLKLSNKLRGQYLQSVDIYSLLVLSLVTVTTYSRKIHHLSTNNRIDLTIAFLPDLIQFLLARGFVNKESGINLNKQCDRRKEEFPSILEAYMIAAPGLCNKTETKKKKSLCVF